MRCLQWDWAHLKLVLVSQQNEEPFTQTSQAIAHYWIICTGLLNLWLSFVYKSRKDFCIFCSSSTLGHKSRLRQPWPNFVAFAGSSGQKPPPDFQPHFFFLSGLCDFLFFCCVVIVFYLKQLLLSWIFHPDVEEPCLSWESCSAQQIKLS